MSSATSHAPTIGCYARLGDERLAVLAGRGDSAAQEAIHGRYADALLGYCRSIVRDPDDAQDVLQQTMLNALQALERRELRAPLRPWLFRIAHNTSISLLRRRRPTDELQEESAAAGHGVSPETEMLARERLRELVDDVAALPERQRTALLLHDVAGLPHAEVAAELGCSDGASRQTVTAARTALREAQTGRDVPCADVRRMVDAGDRRRLRARPVQAHLRTCAGCGLRAARATPAVVGGEPGGLLGGLLSGVGAATTVGAPAIVSGFAGKTALVLTFAASAAVGGVVQGQAGPPTRHVSPHVSPAASASAPPASAPATGSAPAASRSVSGIANAAAPAAATLGRLPAADEEIAKSERKTPDVSFGPRPIGAWSQSGQSPTVGSVADRGRHRPAGAGGHRSIGSPSWHRPSPYRSSPDPEPRPASPQPQHRRQESAPSSPSWSEHPRQPRSPTASSPERPARTPDAAAPAAPEPSAPTAPATDTTSTSMPPAATPSTTPSPEPTSSTSEDSPTEPSSAG